MSLATILGAIRTVWPIITLLISLWSGIHASAAHAQAVAHVAGADSLETQGVHVAGAGGISLAAFLATIWGFAGHKKDVAAAQVAPSSVPDGVDEGLHRLDELHGALIRLHATPEEFAKLDEILQIRLKRLPQETVGGKS